MKEDFTKFTCNNCKKEKIKRMHDGFIYDKGWIYLYRFEFKVVNHNIELVQDLHFCSQKCMNEYISNLIHTALNRNKKKRIGNG